MNIAKQVEQTRRFNGEWKDATFWFEARENCLTPSLMQDFKDFTDKPLSMASGLAGVLTAWDIDWNGEPFPPTTENLAKLPIEFLTYVMERISESWSGNGQTPSASASGSAASAK